MSTSAAGSPLFTIEVPAAEDAEALALVHVRTWREAYTGLMPEEFWSPAALKRRIAMWTAILTEWDDTEIRSRLRIARDAATGEPVGFALAGRARETEGVSAAPRAEELHALNVLASFYGTGAAQALVAELLGERPAFLWVADPNPRAQRFYEKIGFAPDGTVKHDAALDGLREIRMVR